MRSIPLRRKPHSARSLSKKASCPALHRRLMSCGCTGRDMCSAADGGDGCAPQKLDARVNLGLVQSRNPDSVMDSLADGDFRMSTKAPSPPPPPPNTHTHIPRMPKQAR